MLFEVTPKELKEDLYDRENELKALINSIKAENPITLILGPRKTGKTSLLKVGLKEIKHPYRET